MGTTGLFDGGAQFDRTRGVDIPRMPQVEIGKRRGHARRIGQARGRVGLGIARDRAGLVQRGLDPIGIQVGGTGRTLALAEIGRASSTARASQHVEVAGVAVPLKKKSYHTTTPTT